MQQPTPPSQAAPTRPSTASEPRAALALLVERTRRRLRLAAALAGALGVAPGLVLLGSALLTALHFSGAAPAFRFGVVASVFVLAIGAGLAAYHRGPGARLAAHRLDVAHGRAGGLLAVYELGERSELDGFEQVLLSREAPHAAHARPERAAPLSLPPGALRALALLVALGLLAGVELELPRPRAPAKAPAPAKAAPALSSGQAALAREALGRARSALGSAPAKDALDELSRQVDALEQGSAPAQAVLAALAELEARLAQRESQAWLAAELARRGAALSGPGPAAAAGEALAQGRSADAEAALRALAERLTDGRTPPSVAELAALREALAREREAAKAASDAAEPADAAEQTALEEKRKRLLEQLKSASADPRVERELAQTERRLRELERSRASDQQTLGELDRALAEAAQALAEERRQAGEFVERAAGALERARARQLSDDEKKVLLEQLRALRERLQQERASGRSRQRGEEFERRAGGQRTGAGSAPGGEGAEGQAEPGVLELPIPGDVPGAPSGASASEGGTARGGGREPGRDTAPDLLGAASEERSRAGQDVSAVAQDTGAGPSESATILTAAEEGFTSASYEQLYIDYKTVEEERLRRDSIPPGRRSQVMRYFELIRPRGGSPTGSRP